MSTAKELADYDHSVLVDAVKFTQRQHISGTYGDWKSYLQAAPVSCQHNDPARHSSEELCAFLETLMPAAAGKAAPSSSSKAGAAQQPTAKPPPPSPSQPGTDQQLNTHGMSTAPVAATSTATQAAAAAAEATTAVAPAATSANGGTAVAHSSERPDKLLRRYLEWRAIIRKEEQQLKEHAATADPLPPPTSQASGIWALVDRTRKHPDFQRKYSFPSYDKGWKRTSRLPPVDRASSTPRLLALDCEMCITTKSDKALLAVCVVDDQGKQLLKELVRPRGEIVDLKSDLTGISMDDLEGVSTRQRDVTARLAPLLSPETILVGHSLHADLRALQLDHQPVIDTSMLFSYRCQPYG
eukprot:jgi/Chrzof1/11576/Cz06g00240.t1